MEQLFQSVLLLSAAGALLTAVLLLVKRLTKRVFGSRWQYYIWLVVLVVLILPVRFDICLPQRFGLSQIQAPAAQPSRQAEASELPAPQLQTPESEPASIAVQRVSLLQILGWIWLVGVLLFLGAGAVSYWRFVHAIRTDAVSTVCPMLKALQTQYRIQRKIRLKTTTALTAPLLTGIFCPTIVLPDVELQHEQLRYILLHELTHYRRRDLWYKGFAFVVNALHWFNPLVYLAVSQIGQECEISCDLAVVRHMNGEEKKGYMTTILHLASPQKGGVKHVPKILHHSDVSPAQGIGEKI